jgi:hypothetical protein
MANGSVNFGKWGKARKNSADSSKGTTMAKIPPHDVTSLDEDICGTYRWEVYLKTGVEFLGTITRGWFTPDGIRITHNNVRDRFGIFGEDHKNWTKGWVHSEGTEVFESRKEAIQDLFDTVDRKYRQKGLELINPRTRAIMRRALLHYCS